MSRKKLQRAIVFTCVMGAITILIYSAQSRREKQKAEAAAEVQQKAEQKAAEAQYKADQEAEKAKQAAAEEQRQAEQKKAAVEAAQAAAEQHQRFLETYVDTGITKKAGNEMVAVAVASESGSMNHAVGEALIKHFKADHVQLTDSFFKPALATDGLFNSVFNGSSTLFNQLELAKSLNALLLARQTVEYETNADLDNIITAHMSLEIVVLPVTGQIQSQSWTFTSNGTGFRRGEARIQAQERILKQIEADTKMSLGL